MTQDERKEMIKRTVRRALQEWRSSRKDKKPRPDAVADKMSQDVFKGVKDGAFAIKK